MPNDLTPALSPSFQGLPISCLDDPDVTRIIQEKLFEELGPTCHFSKVIALDIIAIEFDIMRLRQAKADVVDGALKAELSQLLKRGTIEIGMHTHFTRRFQGKLVGDILSGRRGIARRVATVLRYYGQTLASVRARAFRSHMDVTQKIDTQLERLERRRRNLRRDLEEYRAARATIVGRNGGHT